MADAELERTRKLWDRYAARYDREITRTERLLFPGGREWACGQAAGDVLEVAVGTGRNLPYYPAGVRLTGIDLSPGMLAVARDRARGLDIEPDLRAGNAQALEFAGAAFDTVMCTISLCNIPDHQAAIAEMYRVLRPGGRLVLVDHVASDRWWVLLLQRMLEQVTRRTTGDYQTRRPLPLAEAAGFVVSHSERSRLGWIERVVAAKPGPTPREDHPGRDPARGLAARPSARGAVTEAA
jgi:ubiquinone/menaquinone biosynthesis C-methylase UbiE